MRRFSSKKHKTNKMKRFYTFYLLCFIFILTASQGGCEAEENQHLACDFLFNDPTEPDWMRARVENQMVQQILKVHTPTSPSYIVYYDQGWSGIQTDCPEYFARVVNCTGTILGYIDCTTPEANYLKKYETDYDLEVLYER